MPRHHVVGRLARHFEVVWVEPAAGWRKYWLPGAAAAKTFQSIRPEDFGITLFNPGRWMPELHRPKVLADWIRNRRVARARRILEKRGCDRIVLYLWRPEFAYALDSIKADFSCYHIDDEYRFSVNDQPNDPHETALIERVDLVLIHSRKLLETKGSINPNTMYVPNGVDYAAYQSPAPEPEDLARIPRPRMGYVGVVKSQLDLGLLLQLAVEKPEWSFVLVGPIGYLGSKADILEQLAERPNVYILGNRQLPELPAYMQAMDVCMMCYDVCDYTNNIYPLKLNEYLATGRPVVSSPIDSVLELDHLVRIAESPEQWVAALEAALLAEVNAPGEIQSRRQQASIHDWDTLVEKIAEKFGV
jgi:glycosyltransferase involved in cell wall biosynthesis